MNKKKIGKGKEQGEKSQKEYKYITNIMGKD